MYKSVYTRGAHTYTHENVHTGTRQYALLSIQFSGDRSARGVG